ncbi:MULTISPECIES: MauE/DoxX family redox-associated membrane protein [unclassified Crossiella]|uniref:MauE/DoxX family redox-associated membrane protein n=1 Tax=unclassified Crossiella TaxID=2620835 RepID=UPI001FFE5070|nr:MULTISPECIES: MauE/DoxX family redox-associated membrane protein [unclassified Crossiella]MCK2243819.1 hypothetical protein [Crossiella sp. S99.2]MCK2257678.1 hypothetical protein [Crossiella sp. S99.1]
MLSAVLNAAALGAALLLLVAGLGHLRERRLFLATLRAQRLLPARLHVPVSLLTPASELLAGALTVSTVLLPALPRPLVLPQAALYLVFTGYLAILVRTRPGTPCGCFNARSPATWATVLRAVLAALATLVTTFVPPAPGPWLLPVLAAGVLLALTAWLAPVFSAGGGSNPPAAR